MVGGKEMLELVLRRQSDRKYTDKPVENEQLERIITAGRMSPSACNAQPWKFIAVTDPELIEEIGNASTERLTGMNSFVNQASALLVIVRERPNFSSRIGGKIKKKDYSHYDIGIAAGTMCLQATAEGLGSCIVGWFDEKAVRKTLSIPASKRIELLITLGHSSGEYREKKRKQPDLTVSFNKY